MKKEAQLLNEVGSYSFLDEQLGNEMSSTGSGFFVEVDEEEEDEEE